jgi:uncharacterized OsmC-like protein
VGQCLANGLLHTSSGQQTFTTTMSTSPAQVTITRQSGYQFLIDFAPGMAQWGTDEPPPLGQATGPAPNHMLMAAVANCLCASLIFALQKFKQDPGQLVATVTAEMGRNESNRLRIQGIQVRIQLGAHAADLGHLERVLAQFEEFCTVSMSVRQGIAIDVQVDDASGQRLK